MTPATRENRSLEELERTWMAQLDASCVFISAREKVNIEGLKRELYERVKQIHVTRFPYNDFLYPVSDADDFENEAE